MKIVPTRLCRYRVALAVLALAVLASQQPAAGHITTPQRRWFAEPRTYSDSQGTKLSDPVNVVFYNGEPRDSLYPRVNVSVVGDHIKSDWGSNPFNRMDDRLCGAISRAYMGFPAHRDRAPDGADARSVSHFERTLSTNRYCLHQHHTRLWGDSAHDGITVATAHQSDTWVFAPIHHERITAKWPPHTIDTSWNTVARRLRDRLNEHCSYLFWRRIGPAQTPAKFPWNGMVTLIMTHHTPGHGGTEPRCPRRP